MLILVVILFLVCWGPRLIMEIVIKCCLSTFNHAIYTLRIVFYLLPFVHSCLNPIVYGFMSTKFRRRMLRFFERSCAACNRRGADKDAQRLRSTNNGKELKVPLREKKTRIDFCDPKKVTFLGELTPDCNFQELRNFSRAINCSLKVNVKTGAYRNFPRRRTVSSIN